ncbi:ATP-binding protein [Candidatus Woesearchaeota archaeon]|nr:ATP-binding protein [Candidatus Woesearchaeota archaeon]
MEVNDLIKKFAEFLEKYYQVELLEKIRKGEKSLIVDFAKIIEFDPEIGDILLDDPEETLKAFELSVKQPNDKVKNFVIRVKNLPESTKIFIRNIRSNDLAKFLTLEGVVRRKSDVRPHVTTARFECPSCGNTLAILQLDNKFKEPSRCSCGRKGKFRLLSKELVDAQGLVLEEIPEKLDGGEQPKRLDIFLKNDLVSPLSEKKTNPGSRIVISGIVKEVPIMNKTGAQSTKFDLIFEANCVESVEEDFSDISISEEEKEKIIELSKDLKLFKKLTDSVAPSIYGHDKIKEALLLQLAGGVRKVRGDGGVTRGDIHILLVGDPGGGKCVDGSTEVVLADGNVVKIGEFVDTILEKNKKEMSDGYFFEINEHLLSMNYDGKILPKKSTIVWKRKAPEKMFVFRTQSGREIIVTPTHPFFTSNQGFIKSIKASNLKIGNFIATPRILKIKGNNEINIKIDPSPAKNARKPIIPDKITPELSRFLAYIIGDGYVQKAKTTWQITFTNNDRNLIDDFSNCAKKVFGLTTRTRESHKGKSALDCQISSTELGRFLYEINDKILKKSDEKRIPGIIKRSSDKNIKNFISAFLDCEADVSNDKRRINVSSASKYLLKDLQFLLQRVGIISQLERKIGGVGNWKKTYCVLKIGGIEAIKLVNTIMPLKMKFRKVNEFTSVFNTNIDVIPNLNGLMLNLRTKLNLSQRDLGVVRTSYQHYERGDRNPSRIQLRQIVNHLINKKLRTQEVALLEQISSTDIYWDKIVFIKEIKPLSKWVYDLQVEDVHNYIANGIFVHNSQLLKRIGKIGPKARYVTGRGATGSGLTATVVKDEFIQGWSLEAGALVLANKGICAIDELDKMSKEDTWSMHEAMEQQSVSISKANIQASLRCETTIIAAANPKFGRFDPYETVASQINLPSTLINRFDLIFPIKDIPDEKKDEKLASFVLELHRTDKTDETEISTDLLRKYLAYVRQNVKPILTQAAIDEIKNYFLKLRQGASKSGIKSIPISTRQLEGMVRLSEASAKLRLSDKVMKKDAQKSVELIDYCLRQVAFDEETGTIDIDRIATEMPAAQRNKIIKIKEIIIELEKQVGKLVPIPDLMKAANEEGLEEQDVDEAIQKLKRAGDVYEPKNGFVSRI